VAFCHPEWNGNKPNWQTPHHQQHPTPGQSTQDCNSITKIIKMPLGQTQLPNAINLHIQTPLLKLFLKSIDWEWWLTWHFECNRLPATLVTWGHLAKEKKKNKNSLSPVSCLALTNKQLMVHQWNNTH